MENENNKKDLAKEKIILFVIGVLVGAVISTVAFFVYTKTLGSSSDSSSSSQQMMPGGNPPEMPSGENGQSQPPEKPSSESGSSQSQQSGNSNSSSSESNN